MVKQTHTVATDALATLGTIIDESAGRDAIHLAVEPVVAAERLYPGQHVGFVEGGVGTKGKPIGIVDPFINGFVAEGQMFWLVVYPRTITSLRHVWEHPDFKNIDQETSAYAKDGKEEASQWIRNYAKEIDEDFDSLIEAAGNWVSREEWYYGKEEHGYYGKFEGERLHDDFWHYYQIFTGTSVDLDKQQSFFTCSC